jgi:hypothetical protein
MWDDVRVNARMRALGRHRIERRNRATVITFDDAIQVVWLSPWRPIRGSGATIERNPQAGVRGADELTQDSATPGLPSNSSNARCAEAGSS